MKGPCSTLSKSMISLLGSDTFLRFEGLSQRKNSNNWFLRICISLGNFPAARSVQGIHIFIVSFTMPAMASSTHVEVLHAHITKGSDKDTHRASFQGVSDLSYHFRVDQAQGNCITGSSVGHSWADHGNPKPTRMEHFIDCANLTVS